MLAISMLAYAALAFASAASHDLPVLALGRLLQGAAGAAAIVFSPGMIRVDFPGARGVQAMGRLGTVAAVVALAAPLLGQSLGDAFGWAEREAPPRQGCPRESEPAPAFVFGAGRALVDCVWTRGIRRVEGGRHVARDAVRAATPPRWRG